MSDMSIAKMSRLGFYAGIGIALVPATVTLIIASTRAILINIIANTILNILSGGTLKITSLRIAFIRVPILWKISMISAVIGGNIVILSGTAAFINTVYLRAFSKVKQDD